MADKKAVDLDKALEVIESELDEFGLAVSIVEDGIIIALSSEKLQELLDLAEGKNGKRVIIFVKDSESEISTTDKKTLLN